MQRALASAALCLLAACSSGGSVAEAPADAAAHDDVALLDDAGPTPSDAPAEARADAAPSDVSVADAVSTADAAPKGVPYIVLGAVTGATAEEGPMIAEGVKLANQAMATACFRDFVLSASWTETNGLSQAQIWEKLCAAPVTVTVDMYLGSWYENHVSKTIGYEKEPGTVHMNRYFVDTAYAVADNIVHEAEGHSQGFSHYSVKATSVPYGLNDAFEACSPVAP